ncbi:MAG: hypothetical protein ACPGPI_07040 [Longimicrobiales bacterium]
MSPLQRPPDSDPLSDGVAAAAASITGRFDLIGAGVRHTTVFVWTPYS